MSVREVDLGSICPFDRFRSPIILVVVNIRPLGFGADSTIFLDARSHMDSILLLQLFVGQMFRGRWRNSYIHT